MRAEFSAHAPYHINYEYRNMLRSCWRVSFYRVFDYRYYFRKRIFSIYVKTDRLRPL